MNCREGAWVFTGVSLFLVLILFRERLVFVKKVVLASFDLMLNLFNATDLY